MSSRFSVAVLATAAFAFENVGTGLAAQVVIPDVPSCASCRIVMEDVVRLDPAALLPTSPTSVVLDSRGRYWLTFANHQALVFDIDGRFLLELTEGSGPGEFRYPSIVLSIGDSIVIFDRSGSPSVLGPALQRQRTLAASRLGGYGFAIHWPDSVMIASGALARTGNLSPFHVASLSGQSVELIRSFGEQPQGESGARPNLVRIITQSQDGGLWATTGQSYEINRWSLAGNLTQTVVRRPSWFPEEPRQMNFSEPPPPRIKALLHDDSNRLWVYSSIPAPTWREGYPDPGAGVGEFRPSAFANEKLYDTTVEVLDPDAGRVIVRQALDRYLVSPLPGGRAAIYDTTETGEPYVLIVRLTIVR